jgi:hypothetical protein
MEIWRFFHISKSAKFEPFYTKDPWSNFFSVKISPLRFKISITTHSKDFCEKSVPNPLDLEDFYFYFFPEIAIFRQ